MAKDFIPNTWAAFAAWMDNFATQFALLAAKYGLTASVTSVATDNAWVQYWVQMKFNAKQQEKQLTDFIDGVANGDEDPNPPTNPVWELPADPPLGVTPGIKQRVRGYARQMKANPIYTEADGELLGIIAPGDNLAPETTKPVLDLESKTNFALECEFRKYGLDALRVEFRHKGGNWQLAAVLTSSPGIFNIVPTNAGEAEQIELRAVFIEKNQPFGDYSTIYTAVIQP